MVNRRLLEIVIEYDSLGLVQHPPHCQTLDVDLAPTVEGLQANADLLSMSH